LRGARLAAPVVGSSRCKFLTPRYNPGAQALLINIPAYVPVPRAACRRLARRGTISEAGRLESEVGYGGRYAGKTKPGAQPFCGLHVLPV